MRHSSEAQEEVGSAGKEGIAAWAALCCLITGYEVWALRTDPTRLLSRSLDRIRATHPAANAAVSATILVTAAHLLRWLPSAVDPFRLARS